MKRLFSFFILLLLLTSCGKSEVVLQKYYTTRTAELSSIDVTQSYVSYLESDIVTTLSSEVPGKVLDVLVREGQTIAQGTPIVSINVDSSIVASQGAQDIIASLTAMQQNIAESFDTQEALIQSQIRQAQIELQANATNLFDTQAIQEKESLSNQSSVVVAQKNLTLAQTEKTQTENIFVTKKSQLLENAKNAITGLMIIDTNVASYLDELLSLSPENEYKNDDYEQFLGVKDSGQKSITTQSAKAWFQDFKRVQKLYEEKIRDIQNPSQADLETVLNEVLTLNNTAKTLLAEVYKIYENTLESVPYMSDTVIEQGKNKVSSFGAQIEQALLSASGNMLVGAQAIEQNLQSLEDEKQKALALLQDKIGLYEAQLKNVEQSTDISGSVHSSQINQNTTQKALLEEKVISLQESLKNLGASKKARLSEIAAQITQAQVQGSLSGLQAGKGDITSPISGVVTKKFIERGNVVNPGQPLLEISDISSKKMRIFVDSEVLAQLKEDASVFIFFEGKRESVSAKISLISPFQDELTRKTQVELRSEAFADIPLGTRASVYLSSDKAQGVTIPKSTIVEVYGVPGVYKVFQQTAEFVHIDIIEQNDDIAVVSGLDAGDEVILLGKENIFDGESLKTYTLLPE